MAKPRKDSKVPVDPALAGLPLRGTRRDVPRRLPLATEFGNDEELRDEIYLIRQLKALPHIWDELEQATTVSFNDGTNRMEGSWALVQIAYTLSGCTALKTFALSNQNAAFWAEAGFKTVPKWRTVYARLTELEQFEAEFRKAAQKLIRHAMKHDKHIGRHVHNDATAFLANAVLHHACVDRKACKAAGGEHMKKSIPMASEKDFEAHRHEIVQEALEDAGEDEWEEIELDDATWARIRQAHPDWERYKYVVLGEKVPPGRKPRRHIYRFRDKEAGVRAYAKGVPGGPKKTQCWVGGLNLGSFDSYTAAPLDLYCIPANTNEYHAYPTAMKRVAEGMGALPVAMSGDRAYGNKEVYEFNTRHRIGSAILFRKTRSATTRLDLERDEVDRHGIVRCKHCGGPTVIQGAGLGFVITSRGEPRIRARCARTTCIGARKLTTIDCSLEWRLLQPLNATMKTYNVLRENHQEMEHVHQHLRDRYGLAGKDSSTRIRRLGIEAHQLRASTAMLLEWLRLCLRHGWLGSHRRINTEAPEDRHDDGRTLRILTARRRHAVDTPYGKAAVAAGLATDPSPPPRGKWPSKP